jgi:hypothetical protein
VLGQFYLAHAGYGGSNNNMGLEVDWRDVKGLVPSPATIGTFTCALVKFVSGIGTEHQALLQPTDCLFPSTGVMTKRIYEQLQELDQNTLWYSVLLVLTQDISQHKWEEVAMLIDGSCDEHAPLHLKIKAFHDDIARGDT